jgi:hypothetical protein
VPGWGATAGYIQILKYHPVSDDALPHLSHTGIPEKQIRANQVQTKKSDAVIKKFKKIPQHC